MDTSTWTSTGPLGLAQAHAGLCEANKGLSKLAILRCKLFQR